MNLGKGFLGGITGKDSPFARAESLEHQNT